ncbi:MAG: hypothetical protein RSB93_04440 [Rikenellaceae bacterium]
MIIKELCSLIDGNVVCGEARINDNIEFAFASDLMSDVLTIKIDNFILITGLVNIQSIRTAEVSDVQYVLFARNKKVTEDMVELALDNNMVIIESPYSMFKICGLLYGAGLKPVY